MHVTETEGAEKETQLGFALRAVEILASGETNKFLLVRLSLVLGILLHISR